MFKAIIDGIYLLREIVRGVQWLAQFVQENKEEKWFQESAKTFTQLRNTVNAQGLSETERKERFKAAGRNIRALMDGL